jgi:integrase
MAGRPRTPIGTFGTVSTRRRGSRVTAETRFRDADGGLRRVTASAPSAAAARRRLQEKLLTRAAEGHGGAELRAASSFADLANEWLSDLDLRELAAGTKQLYRDHLRLHVLPAFEQYALAEITTGRVEWFLRAQAAHSQARAKQSRTLLNLIFGFALRHDAIARNPVEGTSPLRASKASPRALTLRQVAAIRDAAATWRTGSGLPGPKSDGQVRDIIEVLLGTAMRPGEVLALRPCDITEGPAGMVVQVRGTVVQRKGTGTLRQDHPKTHASTRHILVPAFAAEVLRRRLAVMGPADRQRTIFASRSGAPLSPYNVRRTFRDFLKLAGLADSGISLRWYRRTGATIVARAMSKDAAASFLGHTSSAITEGHYIEPDRTVDSGPALHLERTLRPDRPDGSLLMMAGVVGEDELLALVDSEPDDGAVA